MAKGKNMINFDLPKNSSSIIKVIGVGGGGSNAVNHMCQQGIKGVDFIVCNTDSQALDISPVPNKVQLGTSLTEGRGAGSKPEVGRNAAVESIDDVKTYLESNTKMAFITAGMGGGTGTGAAPVIAGAAKDLGILTVGIVTIPFNFEGKKRREQAEKGIEELRKNVDTLLVICNDRLREMYGNLTLGNAFAQADNILTTAARGIAEVITVTGYINVDFEDVRTVMTDSGVAIMGSATAEGENRSMKAVEQALASPLLNDNNIKGARYILLNITAGSEEVLMDEISEITDYIQEEAGSTADIIWGTGYDESLGERISVTVIATGFNSTIDSGLGTSSRPEKKIVRTLDDDLPKEVPLKDTAPENVNNSVVDQEEDEEFEEPFLKKSSDEQVSIEFDMPKKEEPSMPKSWTDDHEEEQPQRKVYQLEDEVNEDEESYSASNQVDEYDSGDQLKRSKQRIMRIKELSLKLRNPSGISELENEPAYKRRNIQLENTPHSSESQVSKYTLSDGDDNKPEIKPNNPFLHDNVD